MQCSLQGPAFTILYFLGQFISSLFLTLCIIGGKALSAELQLHPQDSWRVVCLVLGGGAVGNADFLCSLAMSRVHFSIAFPIYAGLALSLGSTMVYCLNRKGDVGMLFGGVALAIVAILCLAAAETEESGAGAGESADRREASEHQVAHNPHVGPPATPSTKQWVKLCFFCGVLGSMWCPLSDIGRDENRGVSNPFCGLILFQLGQLCWVPLQCCCFSGIIHTMEGSSAEGWLVDPMMYVYEIVHSFSSPRGKLDVLIGVLTGGIVGMGYTLYFLSSASINATVAFAIPSCEPLMTIVMGVCVSRNLEYSGAKTKVLYAAAFCLFVTAILLMSFSM